MWKILKGDFSYYKSGVLILCGTGLIFFIFTAVWNFVDVYIFTGTQVMVFWIVTAMMGTNEGKEKRIRMYSLLPVSVKDFARARMLFLLFLQAGIFFMWLVLLLIKRTWEFKPVFLEMLAMNAILFIVINIVVIYDDLKYSPRSQSRFFFLGGIALVFLFFIYFDISGIIPYPFKFHSSHPKSLMEVIIYNLLCIVLFWWDNKIFQGRKFYIE